VKSATVLHGGLAALSLDAALAEPLLRYLGELEKWNRAYNLTAVRDPAEMVTRHLLDSLVLIRGGETRFTLPATRLLDVGAGAGLPGIVLAIARPQLQVTVLDSNGKKARFMRHAVRTLGLDNVEVVEGRAEDLEAEAPFPAVVSRAFASLADFVRLTDNALAADGQWLAMKGKLSDSETKDIPGDVKILDIHRLDVPGLAEARQLVVATRAS